MKVIFQDKKEEISNTFGDLKVGGLFTNKDSIVFLKLEDGLALEIFTGTIFTIEDSQEVEIVSGTFSYTLKNNPDSVQIGSDYLVCHLFANYGKLTGKAQFLYSRAYRNNSIPYFIFFNASNPADLKFVGAVNGDSFEDFVEGVYKIKMESTTTIQVDLSVQCYLNS